MENKSKRIEEIFKQDLSMYLAGRQRVDEQLARELQRRGEQPEHREQRKHGKQDKQYFFRYPHFATPSLHVLYTASPLRSLIWRSR